MLIERNPTSSYRSHIISHGAAKNIAILMREHFGGPITGIHWYLNPNTARAMFAEMLSQANAGDDKATRLVQLIRNLRHVSFDTTFGVDHISRQPAVEQGVAFETEFKQTWETNKWVADTGPRPARKVQEEQDLADQYHNQGTGDTQPTQQEEPASDRQLPTFGALQPELETPDDEDMAALFAMTKQQLDLHARVLNIPGRSNMNKEALVHAIAAAA